VKKSAVVIVTLFLLIFVWRWYTTYSLHKPVNLEDVSQIRIYKALRSLPSVNT
jgi:hypothetical protein